MRFFLEAITQAWQSLRVHKLRTGLTMFGIIWGIASMIILVGMGKSSQKLFSNEFKKIGKKMIIVRGGQSSSGLSGIKSGRYIRFTEEDIDAIEGHCAKVELASPQVGLGLREVKYGAEALSCETLGVDVNSFIIRNMHLAEGRLISRDDLNASRRVCVLGAGVNRKLFGEKDAVGQSIRIDGTVFEVIGVFVEKGDQLSRESRSIDDDQISVPYTTAQKLFVGTKYFGTIYLQARSLADDADVREEVRQTLGLRHGFAPGDKDALHMFGISEMIDRVQKITVGMNIFLGAASIVTLLIGGIGVMNIMFVSINERIREIGIMKAVGARRWQVFLQFLIESISITFIAGFIGVFIGCSVCITIGLFKLPRFVAAPEIDPFVLVISFLALTLVGISSGILPALRASRMQIIEALRYY
jgi:putative ABC transport system permease protein